MGTQVTEQVNQQRWRIGVDRKKEALRAVTVKWFDRFLAVRGNE